MLQLRQPRDAILSALLKRTKQASVRLDGVSIIINIIIINIAMITRTSSSSAAVKISGSERPHRHCRWGN